MNKKEQTETNEQVNVQGNSVENQQVTNTVQNTADGIEEIPVSTN